MGVFGWGIPAESDAPYNLKAFEKEIEDLFLESWDDINTMHTEPEERLPKGVFKAGLILNTPTNGFGIPLPWGLGGPASV